MILAESSDWTGLAQYGVLGMVVLAFLAGRIVAGYQYDRMEKRAEAAEQREREMRDRLDDKLLPLMTETARLLTELLDERRRQR